MRDTVIRPLALVPPRGAEAFPQVTPELLASVLARYSRSNDGLDAILSKVDLANPEASIERILRFVDYGHASIGGLTGGIAVAMDRVSMWLAYFLFYCSPHADGQEASSRYIVLDETSLPDWSALGFPDDLAGRMDALARDGMRRYKEEYARLDALATAHPEVVRYPAQANEKTRARLRQNFALDRARYFLPFALKTNVALVQTARAWTDTISALLSHPSLEAQALGERLKTEVLSVMAPNLMRHARVKSGWSTDLLAGENEAAFLTLRAMTGGPCDEAVSVSVQAADGLDLYGDLAGRENRYDRCGRATRAAQIAVRWPNISVAEVRDLNRHRTGHRHSPLAHVGFYLPPEIDAAAHADFIRAVQDMQLQLAAQPGLRVYGLMLGSQTPFEMATQLDKFVYTAELRTSTGAHFRYAEHMREAMDELREILGDEQADAIMLGEGEPE